MKKYLLLFTFFITANLNAQPQNNFDLTSPFKLWLLNNEAKAMTELGQDEMIYRETSLPFAILPQNQEGGAIKSEEKLWETHRNIYRLIDELQNIYDLYKRFGDGKFAVMLKQSRPEQAGLYPLSLTAFSLPTHIRTELRRIYLQALFATIKLDPKRHCDLSSRIRNAIKSVSDEDYRLTREYFTAFKALYPTDRTIPQLESFIEQGLRKQFGQGLAEIIKSNSDLVLQSVTNTNQDDPLAELQELSETSSETEAKPLSQMEAPDPDSKDLYNIW